MGSGKEVLRLLPGIPWQNLRPLNIDDISQSFFTALTMSLIHKSIGSRLVATAVRRSNARAFTTTPRFQDAAPEPKSSASDPPAETKDSASMIRKEGPAAGLARHQPDYNAAVDYRSSYGQSHLTLREHWKLTSLQGPSPQSLSA